MKIIMKLTTNIKGIKHETETELIPWTDIDGSALIKKLWDIEQAINAHTDTRCHIEVIN